MQAVSNLPIRLDFRRFFGFHEHIEWSACAVTHFPGSAVIILEMIYYLLKMLETGIFTTKTKTGISFTCLVTEFLGYVKMSVISRYSFFAISLA